MPHVKKDDTVVVLSGKDRDRRGKVLGVEPKRNKVLVDGVNVVRRHTKPRPPRFPQGGIIEKEGPIDVSNVVLLDPTDNKPTRVGVRVADDGERVRYSKRTDKPIDPTPRTRTGPEFIGVVGQENPQMTVTIAYPAPAGIDGAPDSE